MGKGMPGEFVFSSVSFAANDANVRPLACVDAGVYYEALIAQEPLATRGAVVRKVVGVDAHVDLELISS